MSLLIESIRLEDGTFYNVGYHQRRVEDSFQVLFGTKQILNLSRLLEGLPYPKKGLFKCRIIYDHQTADVSFIPYLPRLIRKIKLVTDDNIEYSHKFKDRTILDSLYAMRGTCDDVLIIKRGVVTDSSFANIVFRKSGHWYTPANPLLPGTMRRSLLEKGKIKAMAIRTEQIRTFETFRLVNAMVGFDSPEQDVDNIIL